FYFLPLLIGSFRIIMVLADKVSRKAFLVICVRLSVGHWRVDPRDERIAIMVHFLQWPIGCFVIPEQQLILQFVIIFRFLERDAIVRMVAQRHAEAVCLYSFIGRTIYPRAALDDKRQQTAGRISFDDIGIHLVDEIMVDGVSGDPVA